MSVYDRSIHRSSVLRTLQSKALFCRGSALVDKVSGLGPKVLLIRILLHKGICFFLVKVFSCLDSTVFRFMRVDISSFEMLFAQVFNLFPPKVFFMVLSLSFWVLYLFAMGKFTCSYFCLCGMKPCQIRMDFV